MSKLYLYTVFHANLNYSYIPKDLYPQVLRDCYWPLLRTVEQTQIPLGLEMSGHTLQVVDSMDSSFTRKLASLWQDGLCQVIGCGYVQSVMPLIPARVNRENLRHGNAVYRELLGRTPTMAYVNEMVYSTSLPKLYEEAGFQAIVANWDSSLACQTDPDLGYRPCAVATEDGGRMPVVWHSQAASREFQDYVQGRNSLESYLNQLLRHSPTTGQRAYPLYTSDWDVFDFQPWHPRPDSFEDRALGEMDRIASLLALLKDRDDVEIVTPSSLIDKFPDRPVVSIESSEYPLPYKKQELHSPARWAVGGRDSVRLNTQCHQLYQGLLETECYLDHQSASEGLRQECEDLWQELCFLWNSDFRTFTTEDKFSDFRNRMGAALDRLQRLKAAASPPEPAAGTVWLANWSSTEAKTEPLSFVILTDSAAPEGHANYDLEFDGRAAPCQVTHRTTMGNGESRLTVEATPSLAPGRAATGVIRRSVDSRRPESNNYRIDTGQNIIETDAVRLRLLPQLGGAIASLEFPQVSTEAMLGLSGAQRPQPAGPADGAQSGDLVVEDWLGREVNDHQPTLLLYPDAAKEHPIFVPVRCVIETEIGTIWKTYRVYLNQARVDLSYRFQWRDLVPKSFRLGRAMLNSEAFDHSTLYYATVNGGENVERFPLLGNLVRQDEIMYGGVTAGGCLGATEGWIVLGDARKGLGFVTRPATLYSVPLVHYRETNADRSGFQLSVTFSLGERDETSHTLWRGHSTWSLSILGGQEHLIQQTRASATLANGGLISRSNTNARL